MKIDPVGQRNIANMQQIGGQRTSVRQRDLNTTREQSDITTHDHVTISEQDEKGQKAGETTGIAGRKGAKETRQDKESTESSEAKQEKMEAMKKQLEEPMMPPGFAGKEFADPTKQRPEMRLMGQGLSGPGAPPQGPGGTPPGGGPPSPGEPSGPAAPTPHTDAAAKQKMIQDDMLAARTIYMQMAAERQKWLMKMWQILQDTQTAIMQMMQEVALRRAKSMDAMAQKWAAALGGYG